MNTREFLLIFLLQFEVVSGQSQNIYARAGDAVSLPCRLSPCSSVSWLYTGKRRIPITKVKDGRISGTEVKDGRVPIISPGSQRLSLKDDCSLLIAPVTEEDAGYYTCQQDGQFRHNICLSVMTVKLYPLYSHRMLGPNVSLKCSMPQYAGGPEGTQPPPPDRKMLFINIIRMVVAFLILLVILVVVILFKRKSRRDAGQDRQS